MKRKIKLKSKKHNFHLIWRAIRNECQRIQMEFKELELMSSEEWGEFFQDEEEWLEEIKLLKEEYDQLLITEREVGEKIF